jgi:hypothetical protein
MEHNGAGDGAATESRIVAAEASEASSPDGFASATPESPLAESPELVLALSFLGGLLLAGLVSRFGR